MLFCSAFPIKSRDIFDFAHGNTLSACQKITGVQGGLTDTIEAWCSSCIGHGNVKFAKIMCTAAAFNGLAMSTEAVTPLS